MGLIYVDLYLLLFGAWAEMGNGSIFLKIKHGTTCPKVGFVFFAFKCHTDQSQC